MKGMAAVLVCAMLWVAGCDRTAPPPPPPGAVGGGPHPGAACVVYIRGDALGAGSNIPIPFGTDSMNGARVSVSGKLLAANPDWIVIETPTDAGGSRGGQLWIPRENVLAVRLAYQ